MRDELLDAFYVILKHFLNGKIKLYDTANFEERVICLSALLIFYFYPYKVS